METCAKCQKWIAVGTEKWLEFHIETGRYVPVGSVPETESQGEFPFHQECDAPSSDVDADAVLAKVVAAENALQSAVVLLNEAVALAVAADAPAIVGRLNATAAHVAWLKNETAGHRTSGRFSR